MRKLWDISVCSFSADSSNNNWVKSVRDKSLLVQLIPKFALPPIMSNIWVP